MTSVDERSAGVAPTVDLVRWPDLTRPRPVRLRRPFAWAFVARMADRCGVRVEHPGGAIGPVGRPVLRVVDPEAFTARLARSGAIGFAEAYMAGEWDAPDLVAVMVALIGGMWTAVPRPAQALRRLTRRPPPSAQANDRMGSRRNIAHHYDISNDLFALFLDETLSYSSALFDRGDEGLVEAQHRKIDRLLDQCRVGPGVRLLEIGTGWGELALRAAGRGAEVVTVTLSEQQAAHARRRVADLGLGRSVEVRIEDYRDVRGRYDAIVSVEMIEAVGPRGWAPYVAVLDRRLAPGGRVGLQSIVMDHDGMRSARRSQSWTQKYVFPGGLVPSERALDETVAATPLMVVDRLHFGPSYARTIAEWRWRFTAATDEVAGLGFDDTFRRMWDFYLAQSEAGFRTGYLDVIQLVLERRPGATRLGLSDKGER